MAKDLIIGAFTKLSYEDVTPWVRSIKECGFEGDKVIVAIDVADEVSRKLAKDGFTVIAAPAQGNMRIHMERFIHIFNFLKTNDKWQDYRYVITTDVRDVIFQKNPSEFLEQTIKPFEDTKLVAVSEAIKIKDEPWNKDNIEKNFGAYFYDYVKDSDVFNVGTLAGDSEYIKDLCAMIFQMSLGRPDWVADQAVYNVMVNMEPYKSVMIRSTLEDGWACNLHVTNKPDQMEEFGPYLLEPRPTIKDGKVYNQHDEEFYIVHQWDRVPELVQFVRSKYHSEK
jgi:hypothetical protein